MTTEREIPKIYVTGSYEDLCAKVTSEILNLSEEKIALNGRFTIVLSGGSTPRGIYQYMASSYRDKFQWEKIHFFWSDERWVSPADSKSNYRMACKALLNHVDIPSINIHPIPTGEDYVQDAAVVYERTIRDFFEIKDDEAPPFDLILLGVGLDGHTASLFPGNPALYIKDALVTEVVQKGIPEDRITLTFPTINNAETIFMIVSGHEKANIVKQVLENKNKNTFPAGDIRPLRGEVRWFLDKPAASKLEYGNQPKRIGVAADHGGYQLKEELVRLLRDAAFEVIDFGNRILDAHDDYPDFVIPLARAVSWGELERGIVICGSGIGACILANKVPGVRACLIQDKLSARQGVEEDNMNVMCVGSHELDPSLAWELVALFLASRFGNAERHRRRLAKMSSLE